MEQYSIQSTEFRVLSTEFPGTDIIAEVYKLWGEFMAKTVTGKVGDKVVESGNYICLNCGHYQFFEIHDDFEDCTSCGEPDIVWELE